MKRTILVVAALLCSYQSHANQIDVIVDFAMQQFKQSGKLSLAASCVNDSEANVLNVYKASIKHCMTTHGLNGDDDSILNSCMQDQVTSNLNVSASERQCLDGLEDSEMAQDKTQFDDMNPADFEKYAQDEKQKALEKLELLSQMSQKASKGTQSSITLPVYSPSKIMSHYTDGFALGGASQGLPVAMLTSEDDFKNIVVFYQKKLPHFDKKIFDGEMVVFMANMPDDFDPLEHLELLQKTPHVSIYKLGTTKVTNIEIAYTQ